MTESTPPGHGGSSVLLPIAWFLLAVVLFVFSVMVSLASTGDSINWYMWIALTACAASAFLGIRGLVRRR